MLKAQYAMSNSHCHLQMGARGAVSPPMGSGQGPGGVQGAKLRFYACYFRKETMLTNISSENG